MKLDISKCLLAVPVSLLLLVTSALADTLPAPSSWKNQRGSELDVWAVSGGAIQGEFTNNAAGFECQGIPYPAVGHETASGFFFVVTFAKCNSLTRWQGQVRGSQMFTKWKLFYIKPNGAPGVLTGSDTFQRSN
jgi:Avidin family